MKEIYQGDKRVAVYHNDNRICFLDGSGDRVSAVTSLVDLTRIVTNYGDARMTEVGTSGEVEIDFVKFRAHIAQSVLRRICSMESE